MPVSTKPKRKMKSKEADVDALISKGGSVVSEKPTDAGTAYVQLRLPKTLKARIDRLNEAGIVKVSRHTWILQAIEQRIRQEERESL